MIEVREYLEARGGSPYALWFARLNPKAAAKVATALIRLAAGNFSNVKGVGSGVFEYRIDFGPGYRVYFGQKGPQIHLLMGGSKQGQSANIRQARRFWRTHDNEN